MLWRSMAGAGLMIVTVLGLLSPAAERQSPPSQWMPENAVLSVEIAKPKAILDLLLDEKTIKTVTSTPGYEKATRQPGFQQFKGGVQFFESKLGTDWQTALRKLLGGGLAWSATPEGGNLLIVDAEDGQLLAKLNETVLAITETTATAKGEASPVKSGEYRGVKAWTLNKDEAHTVLGNRLLLSSKPDSIKAALDLRASEGKSLAESPAWKAAQQAAAESSAAWAFLDLATVKRVPKFEKGLNEGRSNPMAALLLAGILESLRQSDWMAAGLKVEQDGLALDLATSTGIGNATGPAEFAAPREAGQGALPQLTVPRQIASVSLYRDLHGFYAAKDRLFPERTSGLIFFENMMGIFFSGRDLTEEVLAEIRPEIRLVVAEQQYEAGRPVPHVQVPAFAAIFKVRNPEQFGKVMEEAWQKAVGLVSFTRGQKGQTGLVIDRPTHSGVAYTAATFSAAGLDANAQRDIQFNFRPALVKLGDYIVLSSTDGLANDLIDALKKEAEQAVKPLAGMHTLVELNVAQLGSIFKANREAMVRQNMIEKGHTQAEAEGEIDVLLSLLRAFDKAGLSIEERGGQTRAKLQLSLNR